MGLRIGNKTVTQIIREVDDVDVVTQIFGGGDIDFPAPVADEVEVTDQESDAREFIQGLVDYGTFTLSGNLDTALPQHTLLEELNVSGEIVRLRITTKGGYTKTYLGFVKSYVPHFPVSEVASFDLEMRIVGIVAVV